jgi:hypothetical protein
MADAKHALELLSREPSAQPIAEIRREAEIARKLDRAEDLAEGREHGLAEGRVQKARANIAVLCRAFGIELDAERRAELEALAEAALAARFEDLAKYRAWR